MNAFKIHQKLSTTIRVAAKLRTELASDRLSLLQRLLYRVRFARASFRIRRLKDKLHASEWLTN